MPQLITLAEAREQLWTKGLPADSGPSNYAQASETNIATFNARLNRVVEGFFSRIVAARMYRKVTVPIYDGQFTLPREVQGALQVSLLDSENQGSCSLYIYSRFHQFADCCGGNYDGFKPVKPICENSQTFRDPESGFRLRVTSTESNGQYEFFGGTDEDDNEYLDSTVTLAITNGSTTTSRVWNTLPRMLKPVTKKTCQVYAVDADNTATLIAIHAPGETSPAYQRYSVPVTEDGWSARVLTRLTYTRISSDTDIVIPSNFNALGYALQAIRYEDVSDGDRADEYWNKALALIDKDKQLFEGAEAQVQPFRTQPGFGCEGISMTPDGVGFGTPVLGCYWRP